MAKDSDLKEIKADYELARKKYNLPKFEAIDQEFEIRLIDNIGFIIKDVRRAVLTHLQNLSSFFIPALDPTAQDMHSMIEMGALSRQDKDSLFKFYRKLMYLLHEGVTSSIVSEEAEADFIKKVWKMWPDIKKEACKYMKKITDEWANNRKKAKEDTHYLG